MTTLHVPARDIPVPTSISPEAQTALSLGGFGGAPSYPDIDDLDAWRKLVATSDESIVAMIAAQAADVDATRVRRDLGGVPVHVVTPAGTDGEVIVLDIHGGALVFLGGESCAAMAVLAARRTALTTWSVDYRMPPDHPYPAGLDDCVQVYRALLEERDPQHIVVSGASAGGNLAGALVLRAKDEGLPLPGALVLHTPEIDLTESGDTFAANLGVDSVLKRLMPVNLLYAAGHDLAHPYLSPLFGDLEGLPPTILTSGTRDLFLSNTVRMHRALRRAGVEAELHVLEAAPHGGFLGIAPEDAEIDDEVRRFIARHCDGPSV